MDVVYLTEFWLPDKQEVNATEDNIRFFDTIAWLENKLRHSDKLEAIHL